MIGGTLLSLKPRSVPRKSHPSKFIGQCLEQLSGCLGGMTIWICASIGASGRTTNSALHWIVRTRRGRLLNVLELAFGNQWWIAVPIDREIRFGPFCLRPAQQLLLEADRPVRIGARALDLLVALAERAGELVTKDELFARVSPGLSVDEGNLKTQMALVRRRFAMVMLALATLITVPGGVIASWRLSPPLRHRALLSQTLLPIKSALGLPPRLTRLIGRADVVSDIVGRLSRRRFITIIGPGGIGKTSVALAVAEQAALSYEDGICVVDCAPLLGISFVARKLASTLGLGIAEDDPPAGWSRFCKTSGC